MPITYGTLAVSPSGTTLLNVIQVSTTAGASVFNEVICLGNPATAEVVTVSSAALMVRPLVASSFSTAQVVVTSAAGGTEIITANPSRTNVIMEFLADGPNIYVGNSTAVASTTGLIFLGIQGASLPMPTTAAIFGIAAGTTTSNSLSLMEFFS